VACILIIPASSVRVVEYEGSCSCRERRDVSKLWQQSAAELRDNLELMRPVLPANLFGSPAAVVPAGMAGDLPVGVQVMGDRNPSFAA
jgi:Asp-tRNA(Asn)/Glu-tRNA(Gln) amidotransferase A subunit family amidase